VLPICVLHERLIRVKLMIELETDRLVLLPFTDDDMEIHSVVFSDPAVCNYYCGRTRTEQETREWLIYRRWQAKNEDDFGFLAVKRKPDLSIIGLVALQLLVAGWLRFETEPEDAPAPFIVELSYAFGAEFQGQGYAAEACSALIDYGFNVKRVPRLTNEINPQNQPSIKLCERLGFQRHRNVHPDGRGFVWVLNPADKSREG
jgi:ribosomal-protein-alanine N-acetyltransferase